jgi:hypothetical protein
MEITHCSCKKIFVLGHFTINSNEFFWLVVSIPLKNMKVSWDDYIFPTEWKVMKVMFQSTNQCLLGIGPKPYVHVLQHRPPAAADSAAFDQWKMVLQLLPQLPVTRKRGFKDTPLVN